MDFKELARLSEEAEVLDSPSWHPSIEGDFVGGVLADSDLYESKYGPQRYYTLCDGGAKEDGKPVQGTRFRVWETAKIKWLFETSRPAFGDVVAIRYLGKKPLQNGQQFKDFAMTVIDHTTGKKKELPVSSALPYNTEGKEVGGTPEADTQDEEDDNDKIPF